MLKFLLKLFGSFQSSNLHNAAQDMSNEISKIRLQAATEASRANDHEQALMTAVTTIGAEIGKVQAARKALLDIVNGR